jgi:hypothetical protein
MLEPCRWRTAAASLRRIAEAKSGRWKLRRQTPVRRLSSPFVPRRLAAHAVHAASRPRRARRRWLAWPHAIWGRSIRPIRRGSIGTLTAIAQVCQRGEPNAAAARPIRPVGAAAQPRSELANELSPCGSPFTSPTSRKTPEQSCAYARASESKPTSLNRLASRQPIAPSAAPAWITSMRLR